MIIDITDFMLGVFASIIASIPGYYLIGKWKDIWSNKPLKKILNFSTDEELIFVFCHREIEDKDVKGIILPRTSTEDFMAINNMKSALLKAGWTRFDKVRDTNTILKNDDEQRKNIISVCSPKSNLFTRAVEKKIEEKTKEFYRGAVDPETQEWYVTDGQFKYTTKTYSQLKKYIEEGLKSVDIPTKEYEDIAYITKITNPYEGRNKILIIAGVRGIGTWGAAECLKKEWNQIYEKLPKHKKDSDFSALVIIQYKNMDITKIKVHKVILISS